MNLQDAKIDALEKALVDILNGSDAIEIQMFSGVSEERAQEIHLIYLLAKRNQSRKTA